VKRKRIIDRTRQRSSTRGAGPGRPAKGTSSAAIVRPPSRGATVLDSQTDCHADGIADLLAAARFAEAHKLTLSVHSRKPSGEHGSRPSLYWHFVPREPEREA
jgi:hypothetical protein